ncbi:MAG: DUF790 family protein, partial [Methanophagales archaeon]|nr:DUF790 family protein [Methanophagales archaeon]
WAIDAEIVIRRDTPRIYHFMMDRRERDLLLSRDRMNDAVPPTFDSSIEKRFYHEFVALPAAKHWELIREPNVIFTRKGVAIPDFK